LRSTTRRWSASPEAGMVSPTSLTGLLHWANPRDATAPEPMKLPPTQSEDPASYRSRIETVPPLWVPVMPPSTEDHEEPSHRARACAPTPLADWNRPPT